MGLKDNSSGIVIDNDVELLPKLEEPKKEMVPDNDLDNMDVVDASTDDKKPPSSHVPVVVLTASPFNTVSPPNKTVSDTFDAATSYNFDDQLMDLGTAENDDDITQLVSLPI